jgi:hypothetical protein
MSSARSNCQRDSTWFVQVFDDPSVGEKGAPRCIELGRRHDFVPPRNRDNVVSGKTAVRSDDSAGHREDDEVAQIPPTPTTSSSVLHATNSCPRRRRQKQRRRLSSRRWTRLDRTRRLPCALTRDLRRDTGDTRAYIRTKMGCETAEWKETDPRVRPLLSQLFPTLTLAAEQALRGSCCCRRLRMRSRRWTCCALRLAANSALRRYLLLEEHVVTDCIKKTVF